MLLHVLFREPREPMRGRNKALRRTWSRSTRRDRKRIVGIVCKCTLLAYSHSIQIHARVRRKSSY